MKTQNSVSKIALLVCMTFILIVHFFYYPKWSKQGPEATISWDVSGYYMYLPAIFIYKDVKQCTFISDVLKTYKPTPENQQAMLHEPSGNYVMKYAMGQAVAFSPFFFTAHVWASMDDRFPADGFSFPYQLFISLGCLVYTFLGLFFLRKALLYFFSDHVTALVLIGMVFGTNYLNYSAIDGAMTHNTLFAIYSLIIYFTIRFYNRPDKIKGLLIGVLIGLAVLTRPTEIIAWLIPLLWGLKSISIDSITERFKFLLSQSGAVLLALVGCGLVGSLQLFYWKYTAGEWLVYSYQNQGFSWLSPHIFDGFFSYKSGWLVYTPLISFALIGFIFLYRKFRPLFIPILIFIVLYTYIAFSWDIWWYGGSLGQRSMIQSYPALAFPLAAFISAVLSSSKLVQWGVTSVAALFIYINLWFTHQAHKGGLYYVGQMKGPYFWKTFLTYEKNPEHLKLLDGVDEIFDGEIIDRTIILRDTSFNATINQEIQFSPKTSTLSGQLPLAFDWIRITAEISIKQKEWTRWQMAQMVVEVKNGSEIINRRFIRLHRFLTDNQSKLIFMDIPNPDVPYTSIDVYFWNAEGKKEVNIRNLKIETFNEK